MAKNLGIEVEEDWVEIKTCLPGNVDKDKYIKTGSSEYTEFGPRLAYYDPWWDLYYLHFMSETLTDYGGIIMKDVSVIDPSGGVVSGYDSGITGTQYAALESTTFDSGAGASLETKTASSDSGGGGWLSDFFGGDSGGGGDVGGSSCGSSCSSCGGCSS